jgi:hypothetical protein
MASSGSEATGRVVSGDNQLAIVEMMNVGDTQMDASFSTYGGSGLSVMSTGVSIPAKGARHWVLDTASSSAASSFGLSPANSVLSAVTLVYSMGTAGYEYAYAPALAVSVGSVQFTEHNTFLGHQNKLVLSNSSDVDVNGVAVTVFDLDGSVLKVLTVDLAARATEVIELNDLPLNTYGAIKVDSGSSTDVVVRNEIYKEGEYVLIFAGR